MIDELKNGDTEINSALEKELQSKSMEFTFKRGYVGSPLHSLENIPQTSLDVQQKPVPPHVTITGSRNRDKADVISHAANGKAIVSALKNLQEKIRCLEKRKTVPTSRLEYPMASLQMDRQWNPAELQSKLEKLEILEQECLKVNATQTRAESKINELEQKLQEEEHQRKLIQDKAAQCIPGIYQLEADKLVQ
ncbi:hypothetical protein scyTo_0017100 [Scyliorhinus torazame]|uniref:Cep57 centrosome localisation domain-containing protein n=1 Tax=Scyliorhinus torazame TaxID=75743 RepID=A0A401Q474_SCYTO|nr:hypothetical protein [Scyliorhinus torazame]